MREVLADIQGWRAAGKPVAVATVVKVWGSAPRPLGARMAISIDGEISGSVSGGCVEGAVVEQALEVLASGQARLAGFGVSDEDAWAVGLSCGGRIDIFIEPLAPNDEAAALFERLAGQLENDQLVSQATVLTEAGATPTGRKWLRSSTGQTHGSLGDPALDEAAGAKGDELLASFRAERFTVAGSEGEAELFVEVFPPRPKLIVIGAVHTAIPLVRFAREIGLRTFVVDPRTAFATPERFAHADRLVTAWPQEVLEEIGLDEATYMALLSHDLKIDLPALRLALASPARYVGALGSRKTHAKRVAALREEGFDEEAIARIRAPIGLSLGGRSPAEIAVSVIAEIVAAAHGKLPAPS